MTGGSSFTDSKLSEQQEDMNPTLMCTLLLMRGTSRVHPTLFNSSLPCATFYILGTEISIFKMQSVKIPIRTNLSIKS